MQIKIADNYEAMSKLAAEKIAALICYNNKIGQQTVLGLATGNTPKGLYAELVRMHQDIGLSFRNVVTFNLDEYWPLKSTDQASYHHFMHEHLFDHIDIEPDNIHIPDGTVEESNIDEYCRRYEQAIEKVGGIDLQLLGIGGAGHLGFNETKNDDPNYSIASRTRRVDLSNRTIADNDAPRSQAITMGLGTIMEAKEILLLASGEKKADIIKQIVEKKFDASTPATLVNFHKNSCILLDFAAVSQVIDTIDVR